MDELRSEPQEKDIPAKYINVSTGEHLKPGGTMRTSDAEQCFYFQTAKEADEYKEKNIDLFVKK